LIFLEFGTKILDKIGDIELYFLIQEVSIHNRWALFNFLGGFKLANHKSALKRARQSEIRRLRNKGYKTRVKNIVKEVQKAADANVPEEAQAAFIKAVSTIQKTASKGVIHKNTAARKVSRLARRINQIEAS